MWKYTGQERPPFADQPEPGQESVWDYPRPPALVTGEAIVEIYAGDLKIATSNRCLRVLETASPPTFYLPAADILWDHLKRVAGSSYCEWKGMASYWALASSPDKGAVGWSYDSPSTQFAPIDGHISFYPALVDCRVNDELVQPQPGGFYGGWVTKNIAGPFKGAPGTGHW